MSDDPDPATNADPGPDPDPDTDRASAHDPDPDADRTSAHDLDPDELTERVAELEDTLRELRREVQRPPPPPRGPFGIPRPPTPGELLRFADQQAIPAVIAILEANVRALELLQGAIRLADSGRIAAEESAEVRDRAERASRVTLDRLDGALGELQRELDHGDLPRNDEARSILEDARQLRDEVRDRLATSTSTGEEGDSWTDAEERDGDNGDNEGNTTTEPGDAENGDEERRANGDFDANGDSDATEDDSDRIDVDVDAELQAIKQDLGALDGDDEDTEHGEDSDPDSDAGDE